MIRKLLGLNGEESKLHRLAHYDYITNVRNRLSFFNDINKLTKHTSKTKNTFALLFFDLDNFKQINDLLGHEVGDEVLRIVAENITDFLPEADIIYRIGGDEFVIISQTSNSPRLVSILADNIIKIIQDKTIVNHVNADISASIGICFYPTDSDSVRDVIKKADSAMYIAKRKKGSYQFYTAEIHEKSMERNRLENAIRRDIHGHKLGFKVLYQPQIDVKTHKIIGVEALVRWTDKERNGNGIVDTEKFIALCEETNLIIDVDKFVLRQACRDINRVNMEIGSKLYVAVNFSPRYIYSKEVVKDVMKIIDTEYTNPRNVEIEITERTEMIDMDIAVSNIIALKKQGIRLAVDDFGIGASSLNYLRKFKVDKLKIDRMFIKDLLTNDDDKKIVNAIISLAYHFDLECTAEGVETKEQLEFIRATGCNSAQGYYYSRPIPVEGLITLLKKMKERKKTKLEEQVEILIKHHEDLTK